MNTPSKSGSTRSTPDPRRVAFGLVLALLSACSSNASWCKSDSDCPEGLSCVFVGEELTEPFVCAPEPTAAADDTQSATKEDVADTEVMAPPTGDTREGNDAQAVDSMEARDVPTPSDVTRDTGTGAISDSEASADADAGTGIDGSTAPDSQLPEDTDDGTASDTSPSPDEQTASDAGSGVDPASVIFEEDFESTGEDAVPSEWHSFVGYVVDMNNNKGGQAYALVDSTKPRSGLRSLHVVGGSSPALLTRALPADTNVLYVRTYVWLSQKLGQNPGNNHETLLGIRKSVGQANDEVRFGEIKGVIGTNEVPSDDISPPYEQWGKGPVITAGEWHCVEVAFLGEGPNHQVIAWSDGAEVHRVDEPSDWNNGALGSTFLAGKFVEFMMGWHSFSNVSNELWFDDLVVATEKIGCD